MNKRKNTEKRKLTLSRETLHALEHSELVAVNGGITQLCTPDLGGCTCNTRNTCSSYYC